MDGKRRRFLGQLRLTGRVRRQAEAAAMRLGQGLFQLRAGVSVDAGGELAG